MTTRRETSSAPPDSLDDLFAYFAEAPTGVLAVGSTPERVVPKDVRRAVRTLRGSVGATGAKLDDNRAEVLGGLLVELRRALVAS